LATSGPPASASTQSAALALSIGVNGSETAKKFGQQWHIVAVGGGGRRIIELVRLGLLMNHQMAMFLGVIVVVVAKGGDSKWIPVANWALDIPGLLGEECWTYKLVTIVFQRQRGILAPSVIYSEHLPDWPRASAPPVANRSHRRPSLDCPCVGPQHQANDLLHQRWGKRIV
jgi:hypothetical protein